MKLKHNHKYLSTEKFSRRYETMTNKDTICMSCADTDFKFAKPIMKHLIKIIKKRDLSYTFWNKDIHQAIRLWYQKQFGVDIKPENIILGCGVMHLIQVTLDSIASPGEQIVIQPPVYPPFYNAIKNKNLIIKENKLLYDKSTNTYQIDFTNLEKLLQQTKTKGLLICHPHNPISRVWTKDELTRMADLAAQYNVTILSDEIWNQLNLVPKKHYPMLTISNKARCITFDSLGKSFNMGGAAIGFGISYDKELLLAMESKLKSQIDFASSNYLSAQMIIAAYTKPGVAKWLQKYRSELKKRAEFLAEELAIHTKIKLVPIEATSLAWLDMSQVVNSEAEMLERFDKIKIVGSPGREFHPSHKLFYRIEIGLAPKVFKEAIFRMDVEFG